jgi:hypothetical protein
MPSILKAKLCLLCLAPLLLASRMVQGASDNTSADPWGAKGNKQKYSDFIGGTDASLYKMNDASALVGHNLHFR